MKRGQFVIFQLRGLEIAVRLSSVVFVSAMANGKTALKLGTGAAPDFIVDLSFSEVLQILEGSALKFGVDLPGGYEIIR